ncbi:tRNA (adenosine(37)-N6)-threonylcarbamoyltransferase complex dimerization subunit type 1 TsaB [Desulforhopalus vacuolatus]|uniref:tRNA (adenosine(37)-N6)-threonylcarbamoyltransferase complex dimerization subunit type 1 TsaB n=1 Tax=Desulforhopalus vacuolatus TaxID=40414 RepID=UPI001962804C|nr:tRNA (adenosine(37)-N6)-threonylcarbamoyltransferase complex dimerization subunit type 1 TsaB [Desulforhopalus vacuolatus]
MKILSFDTATPFCTVAITEGTIRQGQVLASLTFRGITHSRRLLASVDMLMRGLELGWSDLAGVAVGFGPGSFTGLRIGMATARGLTFSAGLPLLGCSTLELVAAGAGEHFPGERICAVLDARKKEVYAQCFQLEEGRITRREEPMVLPPLELASCLAGSVLFAGDGAVLYHEILKKELGERARFAPAWCNHPAADVLGFLGAEQLEAGEKVAGADGAPLYIRKSDAELNLAQKRT